MEDKSYQDAFEDFLATETEKHRMYASDRVWQKIQQQTQPRRSWHALTIVASLLAISLVLSTLIYQPAHNLYRSGVATVSGKSIKIKLISNEQTPLKAAATITHMSIPKQQLATVASSFGVFGNSGITVINDSLLANNYQLIRRNINGISDVEANTAPMFGFGSAENTINLAYTLGANLSLQQEDGSKNNRWSYEMYTTPSIGYVADDASALQTAVSNGGTNNFKNKPVLGLELGMGIQYDVSKKLLFKTGMQVNVHQYALSDATSDFASDILTVKDDKKVNEAASAIANGRLYQFAIPLGMQWKPFNYHNLGLGIGASLLPSFTLNNDPNTATAKNNNYTIADNLAKNVALNASVNIAINYQFRNSSVYFGPQLRYQHLPAINGNGNISKDYHLDYGLRLGIVRPF